MNLDKLVNAQSGPGKKKIKEIALVCDDIKRDKLVIYIYMQQRDKLVIYIYIKT